MPKELNRVGRTLLSATAESCGGHFARARIASCIEPHQRHIDAIRRCPAHHASYDHLCTFNSVILRERVPGEARDSDRSTSAVAAPISNKKLSAFRRVHRS